MSNRSSESPQNKKENPEKIEVPHTITSSLENLSEEALSRIKNRDFLRIEKNNRLKHITQPSVEAGDLSEGANVTFRFKFKDILNYDLYLRTTAGQVLPQDIRSIELGGIEWKRNALDGEFFAPNGQRLIIRDGTTIRIKEKSSPHEIEEMHKKTENAVKEWKEDTNYSIILEAQKRGISPKMTLALFIPQISKEGSSGDMRINTEEILTEFERMKDYFVDDFGQNALLENGNVSKKFLAYYVGQGHISPELREIIKNEFGINEEMLKNYSRKARMATFSGFRGVEELSEEEKKSLSDIPDKTLDEWGKEQFNKRFIPGSKEAQQLFMVAALSMNPPLSVEESKIWATHEGLHYILEHESSGIVGRVNESKEGLGGKGINGENMKKRSIERSELTGEQLARREFGVASTAIGLGQITMSNEKYLPHGRNSIGIPLEEAIGMLQYIRDRYGSPTEARSVYNTTGWYNHPRNGRQYKSFQSGY